MNVYFVQSYTMPHGCGTWIDNVTLPTMASEEDCYLAWKREVEVVRDLHPKAKVSRVLSRRSVEEAFNDRESAICSREWTEEYNHGYGNRAWKFRVTMYVMRVKEGFDVKVVEHYCPRLTEWRIYRNGVWVDTAYSRENAERAIERMSLSKAA